MTVPLQITFRNIEPSRRVEATIRKQAVKLGRFYSRIMSCRVAVEAPENRRRYGGVHHVRIDLCLPGAELVIRNDPSLRRSIQSEELSKLPKRLDLSAPHKSVEVAVRDAFRAARRRLEEYVQRTRGDVKAHTFKQARQNSNSPEKVSDFLKPLLARN